MECSFATTKGLRKKYPILGRPDRLARHYRVRLGLALFGEALQTQFELS